MGQGNVIHLFGWDKKFLLPFRMLVRDNFGDGRHKFIVYGKVESTESIADSDTVIYPSILRCFLSISKELNRAEKIILHSLANNHLLYVLAFQPWLLKKCYWVIWGGDLYAHNAKNKNWRWRKNEIFRRYVIRRIGFLLTYIPGDVELARKWYGSKGKYLECLMYPSNVFESIFSPVVKSDVVTVLVGNSADPSNNHLDIFRRLSLLKNKNFNIICPLSYGDKRYAANVSEKGKEIFGDRFFSLLEFMPYQEYKKILIQTDVAIFAHRRQQAMGNIISLLGLGKKVYIRDDISSWSFFNEIGVKVFSYDDIENDLSINQSMHDNVKLVSEYFSINNLVFQLDKIFEG